MLLVEDSDADAEMTLRTLKRGGVATDIELVRDGVEALDLVHCRGDYEARSSGKPRLILLDLKMPRLDGLQVLESRKLDARHRDIPVVVEPSSHDDDDLLRSYELGVNSYIVKPVDFKEFTETMVQVGIYWMLANQVTAR